MNVRQARLRARLMQRELARKTGLSPATISAADRGMVPGPKVQRQIALALDYPAEALWPVSGSDQ